jgi:hypothetical protein
MRFVAVVLAAVSLLASCGGADDAVSTAEAAAVVTTVAPEAPTSSSSSPSSSSSSSSVAPTKAAPTTTAAPATVPPPAPAPTTTAPRVRSVVDTGYSPYAMSAGVTLHHPSARVEHVGFHQSNHDGARDQEPLPTAARPMVLESRGGRVTSPRSAADVVVEPGSEIRSPVTGTVKRGGPYVLYCDNRDEFLVITPDGFPDLEVKLLHVVGLQVAAGQRLEAGVTVVARHANQLPFESQVDESRTADPAWPHVHIEVVDTTIPDQPNPGSGC